MSPKNKSNLDLFARRRHLAAIIVAILIVFAAAADYMDYKNSSQVTVPQASEQQTVGQSALQALDTLEVKGRAPKTGYSRSQFGEGWGTAQGCDLRNLILQRDLQNDVLDNTNCQVSNGVLQEDPYTGRQITFVRGAQTSSAVQIDHVVSLSDAWQKGAQQISYEERIKLANDPLNLLAVDGPANMEKGDKDAASWLPPNKGYRCMYIARQIAVKVKYKIWITKAEHSAMKRTLGNCPNQSLPQEYNAGLGR